MCIDRLHIEGHLKPFPLGYKLCSCFYRRGTLNSELQLQDSRVETSRPLLCGRPAPFLSRHVYHVLRGHDCVAMDLATRDWTVYGD